MISTKRLLLRKFEEQDLENVYRGLSHPAVIKYYGVQYDSLEATKEQMQWFQNLEQQRTGIWWAICSLNDNEFYGAGGFNNWEQQHRKAEVGFWLLPSHWGKGIMQEAMPVICAYGFRQMDLHRIEGFVESKNANCKKALKKLGWQYEGTLRDCEIKNEAFISLEVYSLLLF